MSLINKTFASFKKDGLRGLALSISHFLIRHLSKPNVLLEENSVESAAKKPVIDATSRYWFINDHSFGKEIVSKDVDLNTINWFIPNFENSSGGHLTIFRLIRDLETLGFKNHIIFEPSTKKKSIEEIRKSINDNFLSIDCPISIGIDALPPAYFSFATNWTTAYLLKNFVSTIEKCYFLQDYEPYFYPPGTDYYLAECTYNFGFKTFTGGNWIADKLKTRHNVIADIFQFGCDTDFYLPALSGEKASNKKRLLFYARPSTPRRGFELAMLAFEKLLSKISNIEIILAGCDFSAFELPDGIKSVGIIPMPDLPKLYRSCDAALIISFTNVSLLPLDLMASGCAVVSNAGPQVEWLLNEQIAMLTEPDPYLLFLALEKILTDDNLRAEKVKRAYDFVADRSWLTEATAIAETLRNTQKGCQARQIRAIS